ncbi:alpha/beta hydrolase [Paractinoplanes ferrugineus]|uniref:Alpha/beta hydrolase n=1 Tax=Paractinoplanes ferrugineus TaxID=113564 RepID=A0A919MHN1_9ACTN|nr:alpha/beta hydrolase [Actinoplanes ferrugineus]GIE12810.1 alpha/beta hydrolase [Actinoplanes ferrugineus]
MAEVRANGIDIWYETAGNPQDPALLLIMGLGAQLIDWPAGFVEQLTGHGLHVVLFDNRDSGLSSGFDEVGLPDLPAVLAGDRSSVPYLIPDLAADAAGLLKELGIERAHVVGVSMGGMIAQQLTLDHPELVASLTSIMSTTGARGVGRPRPEAAAVLMRPPAADRAAAIAGAVAGSRVIGSPGYPAPQAELERRAAAKYDRGYRPQGTMRQYAAIVASPDRTAGLREVSAPTLVIHGADDPLIPVDGGEATAAAVPGAELLVIPGMGHDLPAPLWSRIADAIAANTRRAQDPPQH